MQHSALRRRGQAQRQKFSVGHLNIVTPGLSSASRTSQSAQETGSYTACCPEPPPECQAESNQDIQEDENQHGTPIKIVLNLRNAVTVLKLVHVSALVTRLNRN